jgi:cytochrome c biogenesis protein CcdA
MADTRPTAVSFFQGVWLSFLLLLAPHKFKEIERADQLARNDYRDRVEPRHRADIVRSAFFCSLGLVLAFSIVGYAAGKLMHFVGRCAPPDTTTCAQIVGAALLLWGTLFVRGWEIQSSSGVQFAERVNQWLYRALYCVGTAIIVYSLAFPQCPT